VFHALNRATARLALFRKGPDYAAFLRLLREALARHPTRLFAFCLMPTHWHFVVWPERDGELTAFLRWLTLTHAVRWHTHYHTLGSGHLYQGRFKSFPVASDDRLYAVLRYVERNPVRANLAARAEDWRWSSLGLRSWAPALARQVLHEWPVPRPEGWAASVDAAQTEAELAALRQCVVRGRPFGPAGWTEGVVRQLGLEHTLRPRGRPKKAAEAGGAN
jgi:putative transposase